MTHSELVEYSYRWMIKNTGVGFAFKELKSIDREIPDVIGFDSWHSVLIECKVSRSDFLSDKNKRHRVDGAGMGNWRFYSCPVDLISINDLPKGWGLIYVDDKGKSRIKYDCRKKKVTCTYSETGFRITTADENFFIVDHVAERRIMYTALRRLFIKGHVKSIYDKDYTSSTNSNDIIDANLLP